MCRKDVSAQAEKFQERIVLCDAWYLFCFGDRQVCHRTSCSISVEFQECVCSVQAVELWTNPLSGSVQEDSLMMRGKAASIGGRIYGFMALGNSAI